MEYFVNNVNVTKCEFYIPETAPNEDGDEFLDVCNFPNLYNSFCEENKNCYFKQLQRVKSENEQLHITIEKLKGDLYIAEDSLRDYQEHYNKLQVGNEKLKKELENYKRVD